MENVLFYRKTKNGYVITLNQTNTGYYVAVNHDKKLNSIVRYHGDNLITALKYFHK